MIECIFTLDYEIYGNGEGALRELVLEPARDLYEVFQKAGVPLVLFTEVAELQKIEDSGTDPAVQAVKQQIRQFHQAGHEIALHLHPQWCNARYVEQKWILDYSEYNLCMLAPERIAVIVDNGIAYLGEVLDDPGFTPFSFRAGNWLFQPTASAAQIIAARGIKVDSSVFKGGLQYLHKLDYRPALGNGYFWKFSRDVNRFDPAGPLLEIPIHTHMTPSWRLLTGKRLALQQKGGGGDRSLRQKIYRIADRMRLKQPLKLDFCRMTINEMKAMMERVIHEDHQNPALYRPIVAIGHTKDLIDLETVARFIDYLRGQAITVTTLRQAYAKCV